MIRRDREETHAVFLIKGKVGILTRRPGRQPASQPIITKKDMNLALDASDVESLLALRRRAANPAPPSMRLIALVTGQHFGVSLAEIKGKTRAFRAIKARRITYALCRELTTASFPQIGLFFGKDHTCPLRAVERVSQRVLAGDKETIEALDAIKERIG